MLFYEISSGKIQFYVDNNASDSNIILGLLKLTLFIISPLIILYKIGLIEKAMSNNLFLLSLKALMISGSLYVLSFCGFLILNSRVNIYFFFLFLPIYYAMSYQLIRNKSKIFSIYFLVFAFNVSILQLNLGLKTYNDLFVPYESIFDDPPYKQVY
jgi:hypothetical protein